VVCTVRLHVGDVEGGVITMTAVNGGRCDFCGKPVAFKCDATGCLHAMCVDDTYPRVAPSPQYRRDPRSRTYCPKHADLSSVAKP
jgi:hypothetical protein